MKVIQITKQRMRSSVWLVLFLLAGILAFPQPVLEEGKNAVETILFYVVPSLFPFFICTYILIHTGFADEISHSLERLMRPLFRLSGACSLCLFLGILCGYPVGAKTAGMLYQKGQITKEEAERTLGFCNNAGPLFILGTVAAGFFQNAQVGILLLASHALASLTVGIGLRFFGTPKLPVPHPPQESALPEVEKNLFQNALISAIKTMAQVGGYILLFAALIKITDCLFAWMSLQEVSLAAAPILEITTGIKRLCQTDLLPHAKLVLTSLILGFGGICVYFQVRSIAQEAGLSTRYYLPCKVIQGGLSAGYTALLLHASPLTQATFAADGVILPVFELSFPRLLILATGYMLFAIFVLAFVSFILNLFVRKP